MMVIRRGTATQTVQLSQAMWLKMYSLKGVSCKTINFRHSLNLSLDLEWQSQITVSVIIRSSGSVLVSVSVTVFVFYDKIKSQGYIGHLVSWIYDVIWTNLCEIK